MAMNKEKRVLDTAMGVTNSWKRNGAAIEATYTAHTAGASWDNQIANPLVDYTAINTALQTFDSFVDLNIGEPIVTMTTQMLVPASLLYTAKRIVNATEIRQGAVTSVAPLTIGPNPLNTPSFGGAQSGTLTIMTSPYVEVRAAASASVGDNDKSASNIWWIGNFQKAFRYMEIWPMSVDTLPSNSMWEFTNDIVRAWKVSEFGVPATVNPMHVLECTAS